MRNKLVQPLPEDIATRINLVRDIIIDLTDSLDTHKDCYFNTTSALTAIQFTMSTGNIDAGDICLYGIS